MTAKVLYEKRGEVAYITLNRPEVKNAIDIEAHELMCDMWRDFRDDPALRVAVITGKGDAFTADADLKTHAPVALEMLLTGEPISAERALTANMVARVVPHDKLMETDAMVQRILRCDQAAIESAKETVLEIIGRPLYDQLRVEAMWGYALCGGNTTVMERSQQFFEKADRGRNGAMATPL
jgi:enoyl-CoA hydratase/carnithine racemase